MRKKYVLILLTIIIRSSFAQDVVNYTPLDQDDPVSFHGEYIVYGNDTMVLGPKAFFIDGQLNKEETEAWPFAFSSVNEAARNLEDGSEEEPMILYLAPWVYWIDDPDDPEVRQGKNGATPYGLVIECEWLRFYGLNKNAENVVLACNRGQTIGSIGNFTMFRFIGQGTSSENLTFGNYCNVDLEYPLNPDLNRKKRASAIVQAQLIHCNGDKIVARNTRFISRLNLCPFVGGKRVFFDHCHFESTDDALCATGVYYKSTLDFYSSKPFYHTRGTGAVFLDCDIRSFTHGRQYFTKANGQVTVINTRFKINPETYIGWRDIPPPEMKNYQFNNLKNGNSLFIDADHAQNTVDMTGKEVLDAYVYLDQGELKYNLYNLLRGDDDWDPLMQKGKILAAQEEYGKNFTNQPVQLLIEGKKKSIETEKETLHLQAKVYRFSNIELSGVPIKWTVSWEDAAYLDLRPSGLGEECLIIPTNPHDEARKVVIRAVTSSGLEAAYEVLIKPGKLQPPGFLSEPELGYTKKGELQLSYELDMKREDHSLVTWYRCKDPQGKEAIPVAVSRFNKPLLTYRLTSGDQGYYIKATVAPKHIRSDAGEAKEVITKKAIRPKQLKDNPLYLKTDFKNLSTKNQDKIIPGFWTLKHFDSNTMQERDAWYYGEGRNGAAGHTGLLQGRAASLSYTPVEGKYGNMKASLIVAPFKSAGQGFSIAHLYMDVLIKLDAEKMNGYGVRFIRTTKYGNAVDCMLVRYEAGKVTEISEAVSTSCYRSPVKIVLECEGNKLRLHAQTLDKDFNPGERPGVLEKVELEAEIDADSVGGFGIEYNGGASAVIKEVELEWGGVEREKGKGKKGVIAQRSTE